MDYLERVGDTCGRKVVSTFYADDYGPQPSVSQAREWCDRVWCLCADFLSMEEEIFCVEAWSVDRMEKTRFGCSVIIMLCDHNAFTHQWNRTESGPIRKLSARPKRIEQWTVWNINEAFNYASDIEGRTA